MDAVRSSSLQDVVSQVPWWRSFVSWFIGLLLLMSLAWMGALVAWTHMRQEEELIGKFGLVLEHIAVTAAPFVEGNDLARIRNNDDATSPEFRRVRACLQTVATENDLEPDEIYILRESQDRPGEYQFVAMLQEQTFVGDPYDPPESVRNSYGWVMDMKDGVRTDLYTDDHGTYISGLAPILDSGGESVAILQVDYPVRKYLVQIQQLTQTLVLVAVCFTGLLVALSLVLHRRLRRRVGILLDGTHAIAQQDYDHRVVINASDELGALARALNASLAKLKERFEMLKFLPRHTSEMIAQATQGGGVNRGGAKRVRVAILESDIRGFTELSSELAPEQIISMLNTYLSVQAEVVARFTGTVDKFMGDAVLAIFMGEEQAQRAYDCACEIQRVIARMNREGRFTRPIRVGVGISLGDVVMGNMGSEDRLEYSVIGSPVNLAARLCSQAEAGQVVLSENVSKELQDSDQTLLNEPQRLTVKGFSEPVRAYRFMP